MKTFIVALLMKTFIVAGLLFSVILLPSTLLKTIALATALIILKTSGNSKRSPPGPYGLPILGSLPWVLYYKPHIYLIKLVKKYGPVIKLRVGSVDTIYINKYEAMKKFIKCTDIYQRPKSLVLKQVDPCGLVMSDGELWKHNRKFAQSCLKDAGMGRLKMQEKLQEEILYMNEHLIKNVGNSVNVHTFLQMSSLNVVSSMAFNIRYEYSDPKGLHLLEMITEFVALVGKLEIMANVPWLEIFIRSSRKRLTDIVKDLLSIFKEIIKKRQDNLKELEGSCLLDLYLLKLSEIKEDDLNSQKFLEHIMLDLLGAGIDSTCNWILMYMAVYPEIQKQVHREIDDVIGSDRFPQIEDKPHLPVTVSVIQEVERIVSLLAFSFPRTSDCPVNVLGYDFDPGMRFVLNHHAVHYDQNLWKCPEKFNPSRFINSEGKCFRPPYLVPFGIGSRNCIGEALGKMELVLYFTFLMQNYTFEAPTEGISLKPHSFSFVQTSLYKNMVFHKRN